jgi:hypothetical protein
VISKSQIFSEDSSRQILYLKERPRCSPPPCESGAFFWGKLFALVVFCGFSWWNNVVPPAERAGGAGCGSLRGTLRELRSLTSKHSPLLIHPTGNNSAHAHCPASSLPIACYCDIRAAGPFGLADFHDSHNFSVLLLKAWE